MAARWRAGGGLMGFGVMSKPEKIMVLGGTCRALRSTKTLSQQRPSALRPPRSSHGTQQPAAACERCTRRNWTCGSAAVRAHPETPPDSATRWTTPFTSDPPIARDPPHSTPPARRGSRRAAVEVECRRGFGPVSPHAVARKSETVGVP